MVRCGRGRPRSRGAAEAAARFAGDAAGNIYSRFTNPTVRVFEERLAAMEGAERCVALSAIHERNILVTNAQRIYGPEIAEHVMAMILSFTRGLYLFIPAQSEGAWDRRLVPEERLWELEGKTLLVVGLGGIGTEVARLGHAMGMRVTATRNSSRSGPAFVAYVGLADELGKLAAEADVVVNCLPMTPDTADTFDAELFSAMKPTAFFINVGRGGISLSGGELQRVRLAQHEQDHEG